MGKSVNKLNRGLNECGGNDLKRNKFAPRGKKGGLENGKSGQKSI